MDKRGDTLAGIHVRRVAPASPGALQPGPMMLKPRITGAYSWWHPGRFARIQQPNLQAQRKKMTMSLRRIALALIPLALAAQVYAGDVEDIQQLLKTKQYNSVLERSDAYLVKNPKDAQVLFVRALALVELGRNDDAIKAFTTLSEAYPQLPEPYNNLAVLYAQQNQLDKARTALMMAIQTNPSYAIAHENLGDLYARLASQAYDKALQIEGGNNQNVQTKLTLVRELFSNNPNMAPAKAGTRVASAKPLPTPVPTPRATPVITAKPTAVATPTPTVIAAVKPTATPIPTATPAPTLAPTPSPVAKPANDGALAEVTTAVDSWAEAWGKKDVPGYLAAYSKNFHTPKGERFADWAKERHDRILGPKSIDVRVADLKIEFTDNDTAKVRFRQSYKSDRLSSTTGKTLILEKTGNRWLIIEERT